jgi:N6-L-threonylcarbamoyladenine synthase
LKPPFLCLVVSGGHTHLVEVKSYTDFSIIGRTRDDAAGECFDKTARAMGMSYPGGVHLDKIANDGNPHAYKLPYPKVEGCPWDFSFSGLKTFVINTIHRCEQKGERYVVEDLAASVRHQVCEILTEKTMAAAKEFGYNQIALAGGVSANSLLRARMKEECEKAGYTLYLPDLSLCGDNAAMVGVQGYYEAQAGHFASQDLNATATKSIEEG